MTSPEPIPFIDLQAQFGAIRDEVMAAVAKVFEDQRFILGETVSAFERELAAELGLPEGGVIGVSSGTDALLVSLMALGVGPGDRVLTTPFSFFATAGVISRLGASPEFVDIDPGSMNLDPERLAELDLSRYRAVIVVHLFGRTAAIDLIRARCDPAGVPIVEDAAQAIGAADGSGRACGALGTLGCFSFFPTKNLGAAGDAGAVTTTDGRLADRVRLLRVHGAARDYESELIGGNFRLDAVQAAVLRAKLPHLRGWNRARLENARRYDRELRRLGLDQVLGLPTVPADGSYIAHQYVIRSPDRDRLGAALGAAGIGTAVYYPRPFHRMACFADLGYESGAFPEAERAAAEVLALPVFPELGPDRVDRVVACLARFHSA